MLQWIALHPSQLAFIGKTETHCVSPRGALTHQPKKKRGGAAFMAESACNWGF